ncbi:MAG: hypothetical protein US42_C0007G0064, partial [Candidatus Magasanikbacteria bacterium GW2011_GWC2_37_14]
MNYSTPLLNGPLGAHFVLEWVSIWGSCCIVQDWKFSNLGNHDIINLASLAENLIFCIFLLNIW